MSKTEKRKREENEDENGRPHKKLKIDNDVRKDDMKKDCCWEEMCVSVMKTDQTLHYREVKSKIEKSFFEGKEENIKIFSGNQCPFGLTLKALSKNEDIFIKVKPGLL